MFTRMVMILSATVMASQAMAFDCYLTLAKDSCWTDYNVSVTIIDSMNNNSLKTVTVPKGTQWVREPFTCTPGQQLLYSAQFTPSFWQDEKDKKYIAKQYKFLPGTVGEGDSAWNLEVCFSGDFAEVPMPPEATGNCQCDFKIIPAIPAKAL